MRRRALALAIGLVSAAWASPAAAGYVIGTGSWNCEGAGIGKGRDLVECLSNLVVSTLAGAPYLGSNGAFTPRGPLSISPAGHRHARRMREAHGGDAMARLRTVLSAVDGVLAAVVRSRHHLDRVRADWLTDSGRAGAVVLCSADGPGERKTGWGPSPVQCLADLWLRGCPETATEAATCLEQPPLAGLQIASPGDADFAEQLRARVGARTTGSVDARPMGPAVPWVTPSADQIRRAAAARIEQLSKVWLTD